MLRSIGWVAVAVGLFWLAAHFAVWRLAGQLAVIAALGMWVAVGMYLLARTVTRRAVRNAKRQLSPLEVAAAQERQKYVERFGEAQAAKLEHIEPQFWERNAARTVGQK